MPDSYDPSDCSPLGSSVLGFPKKEYWNGLPFPFPEDLPDPGIEPTSPALARFFTTVSHEGTFNSNYQALLTYKEDYPVLGKYRTE